MADLIAIPGVHGEMNSHVIFLHGLGGHAHDTWRSLIEPKVCWPQWLAEDIEGLAVWTIGYEAAVSRWRGSAMHLTNRATNVLERILAEPRLQTGEIILIGHSLGGLVIKQLLRTAESMARQREDAANFVRRVRRVAFLATPHSGTDLAAWANRLCIFIRPSAATACLVRNDPHLQDLNLWYRDWSTASGIAHLILTESKPIRLFGIIVKPDSSDPGLSSHPVSIDADHITICKPKNRSSEIYVLIRSFVTRRLDTKDREAEIEHNLKEASSRITTLIDLTQERNSQLTKNILDQGEKTANAVADRLKADVGQILSSVQNYPRDLVDSEIEKHLSKLRRARFFGEFSASEYVLGLAEKIQSGEFVGGSNELRSSALAWCARILSVNENTAKCDEILRIARQLGNGPEITVAEAFRISANGNFEEALSKLASVASANARSAAFLIATRHKDAAAAIEWLSTVGFTPSDLDADGRFILIAKLLELSRWAQAFEHTSALHEEDFQQTPTLLHAAAMATLVQAITDELRSSVLYQVPFEAHTFPLASNEASLRARRKAQELLSRFASIARELACVEAANSADDYALWLELRDPEGLVSGRQKLAASMCEPAHSLRRLHLAMQFGLKPDLEAVEQEIERQTALSGGKSHVAAMARFSLAFAQGSPKAIVAYLDRHRAQLQEHLDKKSLSIFEIEMLARAGLSQRAEERLKDLIGGGLSEPEKNRLHGVIAESTGVDPTEARRAQFESSGQLNDLVVLVNLLEKQKDWPQLGHYGSLLFEKTLALPDAERLARALSEAHQDSDLRALLRKHPEFLGQSDNLQTLWSWSLYREGSLADSAAALEKLRAKRDDPNDRALAVNLAIASGTWETLLPFVETEWVNREKRGAEELIRTAQLAQFVRSPRAKELVYEAVSKGANDAGILLTAYTIATSAGWEHEPPVGQWLHKAAELSGDKGPVQRMSVKELLDRKPDWDRRENETWQKLSEGTLPIYGAACLLNRSLVDMFLVPTLANPSEPDPRKHALVPAYSGVRQSLPCNYRLVAVDATALLTFGVFGLLETACNAFDRLLIPHSTLAWLFEEKQKVSFHQPTRIKDASKLGQLLTIGALKEFTGSGEIDADLAAEVGEELASLIAEAQARPDDDHKQRVVIRSSPVHRIGSLMEEEADLSPYRSHLCSCLAVVNKLKQKGQLTVAEERRARSYLCLHEKQWPHQPEVSDGAILYLDDLSVSDLQHAGLLEKLRPAGLEAYVSARKKAEVNSLLRYEQLASDVNKVIETARTFLAASIQTGKVKLGEMPQQLDEADDLIARHHPAFAIIDLAKEVEAIFVDDRFLNQHQNFDTGSGQTAILTTLDLLDALYLKGDINLDKMLDCRTNLRRASYIFVPVTNEELARHLSAAEVVDGRLIETAELKAIRENLLQIRMSRFLELPKEAPWLNSLVQTFTLALKGQWHPEIDESTSRARSEWLLQLLDVRGWDHCLRGGGGLRLADYGYRAQILSLLTAPPNVTPEVKQKYWEWIDERISAPLSQEDPEAYSWLIERIKEVIAHLSELDPSKESE